MFRRARDAANQMAHSFEVEAALHFALDHLTHKSRLASFLGSGATPQRFTLRFGKPDGQRAFHKETIYTV
jgi:hypothetical protein